MSAGRSDDTEERRGEERRGGRGRGGDGRRGGRLRAILEDRVCAGKTRREADAQSEERRESGRGGGGGRAGSQQANNENISWNGNFSGKREEEKRHVVA
eukprot:181280-Hanusia_phi.AAC.1